LIFIDDEIVKSARSVFPGESRTYQKHWIPAFWGMTKKENFGLFMKPSLIK